MVKVFVPKVAQYVAGKMKILHTALGISYRNFLFWAHSAGVHIIAMVSRELRRQIPICYGRENEQF